MKTTAQLLKEKDETPYRPEPPQPDEAILRFFFKLSKKGSRK